MDDFALLNEKSAFGLIGNPKIIKENCKNLVLISYRLITSLAISYLFNSLSIKGNLDTNMLFLATTVFYNEALKQVFLLNYLTKDN